MQLANRLSPGRSPPKKSKAAEPSPAKTRPRSASTVRPPQAFAPVPLAWQVETGAKPDRLNPLGGAIALGHPLGCTGAKLTATALHELRRRGGRYAVVTMCIGGGQGAAALYERP